MVGSGNETGGRGLIEESELHVLACDSKSSRESIIFVYMVVAQLHVYLGKAIENQWKVRCCMAVVKSEHPKMVDVVQLGKVGEPCVSAIYMSVLSNT